MHPSVARAAAQASELARRLGQAMRRHPVRAAAGAAGAAPAYVLVLIPFTPSIGDLRKAKSEVPAVVMSADGVVLAEYKRINRQWVPLKKISPHVVNALIATEDHRFYQHHGIDLRRTGGGGAEHLVAATGRAARPSRSSSRAICIRRRSAARSPSRARSRKRSRR